MSEEEVPWDRAGLRPGSRLAGYLLEDEIGHGGMGVVYRAYDDRLERRVALKVLMPALARDGAFRKRFILESRAAAGVDHPHIIPVFGAGEADGVLYVAMRYVPGGDVRLLVDRAAPLPAARACALIAQVASALDAAHSRGLVHRDVKPANMLLDLTAGPGRDHVFLSDFGLATPVRTATAGPVASRFPCTVDYVAPEQARGRAVDGRADQYSLACACFEMLCGSPPFRRDKPLEVLSAQVSEPPPALAARRPDLPAAVDVVLARALAKDPAGRYPRCQDFAEALLAACGISEPAAARPQGHPPIEVTVPSPAGGDAGPQPPAQAGQAGAGVPPPRPAASPRAASQRQPASDPQAGGPPRPGGVPKPGSVPRKDAAPAAALPLRRPPLPPGPGTRQDMFPAQDGPTRHDGPAARQDMLPAQDAPTRVDALQGGARQQPGRPGGDDFPRPRRTPAGQRRHGAAAPVAVAVVVVAAATAYLTSRPSPQAPGTAAARSSPPAASSAPAVASSAPAPSVSPAAPPGPAATVRAYFAAINDRDYARAWELGGKNTGTTFPAFANGFSSTRHDTVDILAVTGRVVTARVSAWQTDGSVRTYQGTYRVKNGVIARFHVSRIG
jgi:hypothetical protein